MARADSTVRVNVIGDARSLERAASSSEKSAGKIGGAFKGVGLAIAGAFAVDQVLDFAQTALGEADRIGDATARLEASLGKLSQPLIDAAGGLETLGQSRQDVLELEARFTDLATAAQLSADQIVATAPDVAEASAALALLGIGGGDAATVLDLIGKAAGGADKPLKELGISVTDTEVETRALRDTGKTNADALTDQELAAARLALIMEDLAPKINAVTGGTGDLEQKQSTLQARFETLTGKIGEHLEGPLSSFIDWILSGIDGLERLDEFIALVEQSLRDALGPIARMTDALRGLLDTIGEVLDGLNLVTDHSTSDHIAHHTGTGGGGGVTVNVQGGSPEVIETAVKQAIQHAQGTGSLP